MNCRNFTVVVALGLLLLPGHALAQASDTEKELARRLYDEADKEIGQGLYATACPKLEAVHKIMQGHVRTLISLADCNDKWGKPATAFGQYTKARQWAQEQNLSSKVTEIDAILAGLNKRVPRLKIIVPREIALWPGLTVLRDGSPVLPAQWGEAVAVDPGVREIEVSGVGRKPWKTTANAKASETVEVTLAPNWQPLTPAESGEKPPPNVDKPPVDTKPVDTQIVPKQDQKPPIGEEPPPKTQSSIQRNVGFLSIGLGGAGLLVGGILGGLALSKNEESNQGHCDAQDFCDDVGYTLRSDAVSMANTSSIMFAVGGVLAAGGLVLVLTAPSTASAQKDKRPQTSLWIGPSTISLQGRW